MPVASGINVKSKALGLQQKKASIDEENTDWMKHK